MIPQNGHALKVEKSRRICLTSFAGIPLLTQLAHQTGLIQALDRIPGLWQRRKDRRTSDYLMGLALTLVAGGEKLNDTRILRHDPGLSRLALPNMPAPTSLGEFLRRFRRRSLFHLAEAVADLALRNIQPGQSLTIDMDSTLIEAEKKTAKMTYKGFTGYNPVLAWLAEPNVFLAGIFREGNASPQSHLRSLLHACRKRLPRNLRLRMRVDSAGYRLDLIQYCHRHGIEFTITADLDPAVREAIEEIRWDKAQLVVRGNDTFLLSETIHVPGGGHSPHKLPAFRLVVTRRTGQLDLFGDPIKYRAILTDLPETMSAEQVLDFHNGRGNMEKAIGELKGGIGLHGLPCGDLFANAAFFQSALLAYNLVQTFKKVALPTSWLAFSVKSLRFRLLCQGAMIVRHARRLILKLCSEFPFFDVFERARWAVLSPSLAPAPA